MPGSKRPGTSIKRNSGGKERKESEGKRTERKEKPPRLRGENRSGDGRAKQRRPDGGRPQPETDRRGRHGRGVRRRQRRAERREGVRSAPQVPRRAAAPRRGLLQAPKVLEMVSLLSMPDFCRGDLANLLKDVQVHEKEKLNLTARIQVLKKAGRPSERLVNHEDCRSMNMAQHVCVHLKEITEAAGTEDAEADAEYDGALKEAIQGVQEAVTSINEHMEEVRYEIDALDAEMVGSNLTEVEEAFPDTLLIK